MANGARSACLRGQLGSNLNRPPNPMLVSFTIDDNLATQEAAAIEVTLTFENGERRWCYFMTPTALAACGDLIPGTNVRFHHGSSHMVVVAGQPDRPLIERVIEKLDASGQLVQCSRSLDEA